MCGPSSGWSKVALVVLLIGMTLHIAGWATMNWMTYDTSNNVIETNVGLWRMESCNSGTCSESSVSSTYETDSFNAVRGLETTTFCLVVFGVILLLVYTCAEAANTQTVAAAIMIICYLAGACSFVGMVVFLTTIPDPFVVSWSLGLTVIAMTLILIAGTLMIPDSFEPYDEPTDDDDDYFNTSRRRTVVTPMSIGKPRHSITPISYKGGVENSRWRSY